MNCELIEMKNINKKFGQHLVLSNIDLKFFKGEVCCILGENGAGKSTLMKILAGIYKMDSGELYFEGKKTLINTPQKAQKLGIRMIFQEGQLFPELTVAQNIFLRNEIWYKIIPFVNQPLMDKKSAQILDMMQCSINVKSKVSDIGFAERQMVEIARALTFDAKLIIFDEPTSGLLETDVIKLFNIINQLRELNVAIVYISHRIEEVKKISDRIIILRDGQIVDEKKNMERMSTEYYIQKMTGEEYLNRYPRVIVPRQKQVLRVENLTNEKHTVTNVNFVLNQGEIIGLAGLQGSGKSSVAKLVFGLEKKLTGKFYIHDREVVIKKPSQAINNNIAYLSEYVMDNIFIFQDTTYNISIMGLKKMKQNIFLNRKKVSLVSKKFAEKLYARIPFLKSPVKNLSHGMLQKLSLIKILFAGSKILILDEPSKDLDIPSKVELYNIMNQLTNKGVSILLISSDVEELVGMCDRIYIMFDGTIVKELKSPDATSVKILYYATGKHDELF